MSDAQIFQIFGLTFFAIGMGMLANPKLIKSIMDELKSNTLGALYGGLISFTIGFFLVTFHNTWNGGWSLIITIMGWLSLFKGLAFLIHPAGTYSFYKKILGYKNFGSLAAWFVIILGLLSLYLGYFAY